MPQLFFSFCLQRNLVKLISNIGVQDFQGTTHQAFYEKQPLGVLGSHVLYPRAYSNLCQNVYAPHLQFLLPSLYYQNTPSMIKSITNTLTVTRYGTLYIDCRIGQWSIGPHDILLHNTRLQLQLNMCYSLFNIMATFNVMQLQNSYY